MDIYDLHHKLEYVNDNLQENVRPEIKEGISFWQGYTLAAIDHKFELADYQIEMIEKLFKELKI